MRRLGLLAAVSLLLIVPAATVGASDGGYHTEWDAVFDGTPGHLDVIVGPDAIRFSISDIAIEDEKAQKLRAIMDSNPIGDEDGMVSDGEVIKFEAFVMVSMNSWIPYSFDMDLVRIDAQAPYSQEHRIIHVESVDIHGAEGSIASTDPITADISFLLRFETVDTSLATHTLRLENIWGDLGFGDESVPEKEIRIQGYRSWEIQPETIQPAVAQERFEAGVLVFTPEDVELFQAADQALVFEIQGDPSHRMLGDTQESPAIAPLMMLVLALGAIVGLRRRK
jgi:hypothetical protein